MTVSSPPPGSESFSAGTSPDGECGRIAASVCPFSWRSGISRSSNGAPTAFSTSHARSDQVDQALVPMTISMGVSRRAAQARAVVAPSVSRLIFLASDHLCTSVGPS